MARILKLVGADRYVSAATGDANVIQRGQTVTIEKEEDADFLLEGFEMDAGGNEKPHFIDVTDEAPKPVTRARSRTGSADEVSDTASAA